MNWWSLAGSLAAILLLAAVAWRLRLGGDGRIETPEAAADAADHQLSDFVTGSAVVGVDGLAALAVDRTGARVAVVKRHGARLAVREVGWAALRSTPDGVLVETGERRFGRVAVAGVDALHVRRLAPQAARV